MLKNKYVTIRLSDECLQKIKAQAKKETRSVSAQIVHFIKMGLEK